MNEDIVCPECGEEELTCFNELMHHRLDFHGINFSTQLKKAWEKAESENSQKNEVDNQ